MRLMMTFLLALAGLLAVPTLARAQGPAERETSWRPEAGDRSIEFDLPEGGASRLGIWWHSSPYRAWGLRLGVDLNGRLDTGGAGDDRYSVSTAITVGPAFKRYREPVGPVSPYFFTAFGVTGGWQRAEVQGSDAMSAWQVGVSGDLGLGVDWFPLDRISIGGYTGVEASYLLMVPSSGTDPTRHLGSLGLGTSTLALHIYF